MKAYLFLALLLAGCAGLRAAPPADQLRAADENLVGWREKWAPLGKPAEGEEGARAEEAYDRLRVIESKHAEEVSRERLSFLLAEASFATGRLSKAFAGFRSHLENYPTTENRTAIEKYLFQIGVRWSQTGGSFLGTGIASDEGRALDALNYLVDYAPRSPYADDALRLVGEIQLRSGDFSDAIATFERILQGYPESIWIDLAQFRIAEAYLRRVQDPRADRDALLEARSRFRDYLARRAEGAFRKQAEEGLSESEEKLAESEYRIGEFYQRVGKAYGARFHFAETVKQYPGTRFAALAAQALAGLPPEASDNPKEAGSR